MTVVTRVISFLPLFVSPRVWALTDEALLAGYAIGDAEATAAFVARFERRVYGVALTITRDARVAEDLAQEACLRAWRHAQTFDPRRGAVATWLTVITRNLAIDTMRTRPAPEPVDPDEIVSMSAPRGDLEPSETVARLGDVEWLRQALRDLPDEQRRAVVLAGVSGYTAHEVAEQERIPIGTAKSRIRLAMDKLRRALAEKEAVE